MAPFVVHGASNANVAGSIPAGTTYTKDVWTHLYKFALDKSMLHGICNRPHIATKSIASSHYELK